MLWRLRKYIRKNYKAIPPHQAMLFKKRLATCYAFTTWNLFVYLVYSLSKEYFPKYNNAAEYAKLLGVTNASVLRLDGFEKSDEYEIQIELDDEQKHKNIFTEIYD